MTTIDSISQGFTANLGGVYPTARQSPFTPAHPIVPRSDSQTQNSVSLALGSTWSTNTYNGIREAFDYLNMLQVAGSGVDRVSRNVTKMQELAADSSSTDTTDLERSDLDAEYSSLMVDIDETVKDTTFKGRRLLDGSISDSGGRGIRELYAKAMGLGNKNANDILSSDKAELVLSTLENRAQRDVERSQGWLRDKKASIQARIRELQDEAFAASPNTILNQQVAYESMSWLKDQLLDQFSVSVPMQATRISDNAPSLIQQADAAASATNRASVASSTADLPADSKPVVP